MFRYLHRFLLFSSCFLGFQAHAQNFQNVFRLDAQTTLFNAVKCEQGEFWITGSYRMLGNNFARSAIYKISELGDLISMDTFGMDGQRHLLGFSQSELERIDDSTFITWYVSTEINKFNKATYLTFDNNGNNLSFWIDTTLALDEINCINGSDDYRDTVNNDYYTILTVDKYQNSVYTSGGVMISKMSKFFELDWRRFILKPSGLITFTSGIFAKINKLETVYSEIFIAPNLTGSNSKIHFVEMDTSGNILRDRIFQPHLFTQAASGVQLVNNGQNYLMTYSESKQGVFGGQNTVIIRPVVALLDSALNVIWKDSIEAPQLGADFGIEYKGISPKDYVIVDSNFVFARMHLKSFNHQDSIPFSSVLIDNRQLLTGEINWRRDFRYYNLYDTSGSAPHYELYDASFVPWDSGYVFVGTSYNYDSLGAGVPGQLGYVLKTNCLGHLGDPIAGATYTFNDSMGVHFESTSIQDGSVTWHFGDGETETRGEYQDSAFHQYDSSGTQEIMLVAHGCLEVKDTLLFTIEIPAYTPPIDTTETPEEPTVVYTKTLAIGPNPVASGEPLSVYLGELPEGGATLFFYDQQGKILQQFSFPQGQSMYLLPLELSAGVYELALRSGEIILDKERLVVR